MRLLLICRGDPFATPAGTEIFVGNLAVELTKQGHEVDIVYEGPSSVGHAHLKSEKLELHGLQLIGIPYFRALHYRRKCSKVCIDLISKFNVDMVISFGAGTFAGHIFKRIQGSAEKPFLIYYAVDSMVAEYERSRLTLLKRGVTQRLKAWIWYNTLIHSDRLSCNVADLAIASCKDTANKIIKDYDMIPGKVKVVYFGVPDNYAEGFEIHDNEIPTFLHISTSPERKGTLHFLEALKILRDEYNLCVKGVVAGSRETFYVDLAKKLKVDVAFLGRIPNSELKKHYASCTALVSPSLSEGFCLPVVEAAMFSKPAIVTKAGSLPELVIEGENGFIVPVGDVSTLSERMYRIAVDNPLRTRLSEKSKKISQGFKISSTAKTFVATLVDQDRVVNRARACNGRTPKNIRLLIRSVRSCSYLEIAGGYSSD